MKFNSLPTQEEWEGAYDLRLEALGQDTTQVTMNRKVAWVRRNGFPHMLEHIVLYTRLFRSQDLLLEFLGRGKSFPG